SAAQARFQQAEGTMVLPGSDFRLKTITDAVIALGSNVGAPAIGAGLQEVWSGSVSAGRDRLQQAGTYLGDLVPDDRLGGDARGRHLAAELIARLTLGLRRKGCVAVVFADEDNRQAPQGRQVDGFPEDSLVRGPFAKTDEHHAVLLLHAQ